MNKTQTDLIAQAKRSSRKQVAVEFGFITGIGKPRSYGSRAADAAHQLCLAGLLEHVSTDRGQQCGHRTTTHYCTVVYRLTPAGEAA